MIMQLSLFTLSFFISIGLAKIVPDYIHPCSDTTSKCLIAATQEAIIPFSEGVPSLGVPRLDPFEIKNVTLPSNGLNIIFTHGKLHGLKSSIVDDVKSDLEKRFFKFDFHCNLTLIGDYQATGNILSFPINGGGAANIKLYDLVIHLDINTKYTKDKKGVNHFAIKNYKYNTEYRGGVTYYLENLIKGNKMLSDQILRLMNEQWKSVIEDFGGPIVDFAMHEAMTIVEIFLSQVSYEELIYVPIPKH